MKQTSFFKATPLYFGGALNKGQRKNRRPLCTKRSFHLVLKSQHHNLFKNKSAILELIHRYEKLFGIRTYGVSVQKDHLHLVVKISSRIQYLKFIRTLTGMLSRQFQIRWKHLPFTRVIAWGRAFKAALNYLKKNEEELMGLRIYEPRKHRYKILW